jgi:L-ascorbate metabolism protein UlaG (beta-lactamase superfamily)
VAGIYDLMSHWHSTHGIEVTGFNKGGHRAWRRAGHDGERLPLLLDRGPGRAGLCAGGEAGFMIAGEGRTIYVSGDTDIMADMGWMGELHRPDIGILCCGGHYTMDMERAAWAAKRFFDFKVVIPCHYRTFPALAQSAEPLRAALQGVDVRAPEVMEAVEL